MNDSSDVSKFSIILSEIHKLAEEALTLSESRRLQERLLSDEVLLLSENRRLTERANSDKALSVAEDAFGISEKRRLTERDHADQAFTLEEKRRITERDQAAQAFSLVKEQGSLEVSLAHQEINKLNRQIIQILESMHETCLFFYDNRLIYVNTQALTLYWPSENIIGKTLSELLPEDISKEFLQTYRDNRTPPSLIRLESDTFQPNKSFQFFFYPSDSGFLVCFNDITKTKPLEKNY